ncbi:IclR family transcriptional regulator [Nitratireductor sp. GISD-1A_MAKvit]|uniref:IclR family transcriptional regulator n=1 Tax=Nitratireductor sp. GISD-1A_MAKvit TaxID=3234198 RepID=UPI0034653172
MTVAAVERCLSILTTLAGERDPMELTDIAVRNGLPASAVHRILTTLATHGWVTQDPDTQRYALSLRMSTLAFRNLDARAVPEMVQSVLDALAQRTREYCRLAIVEGDDLVWVARAQGATSSLRYEPPMGQEIILHATANGKAWLATLPEEQALELVRERGFDVKRALGPNSVSSMKELKVALEETRALGYATSIEEAEAGTMALAVPFHSGLGPNARVAGTISVAGPLVRLTPDRHEELAGQLHEAAREIGGIWPLRNRQRDHFPSGSALDELRGKGA